MKKYIIFLGLNDKDTKLQIVDNDKAFIDCQKLVAKRLWGGTLSQSKGVFMHDDGTYTKISSV